MGGDWSSATSMESGSVHSGPPEPSKKCLQCKKIQCKSMYTSKGWDGNGLCEPCRDSYSQQKKQERYDAKMAEQETKVDGSAKSGLEILEAYNNFFGTSEKGNPAGRKQSKSAKHKRKAPTLTGKREKRPYNRTKPCEFCGKLHHFRQKCPTAPPADMHTTPQVPWAVSGKDYADPTPDMGIDRKMPGAWADRSPRRKKVATLTSSSMLQGAPDAPAAMHETTQKQWAPSQKRPDGLRGLREVAEEKKSEEWRHKLLHHRPRDVGIQCNIPSEIIIPTDNGDFVVTSFVPKGRPVAAVPRDIN